MKAEELEAALGKAGCVKGSMSRVCETGEVLYMVVVGLDGKESVTVRCGGDCVLVAVEDVAYVGRTTQGLKVHVRGGSGGLACLTLGSGRKG